MISVKGKFNEAIVYTSNVEEVVKAGANIIVSGSGIFRGDAIQNTKDMLSILEKYE